MLNFEYHLYDVFLEISFEKKMYKIAYDYRVLCRHPVDVLSWLLACVTRWEVCVITRAHKCHKNPLHFHCCAKIGRLRFSDTRSRNICVTLDSVRPSPRILPTKKVSIAPINCIDVCISICSKIHPPSSSRSGSFVVPSNDFKTTAALRLFKRRPIRGLPRNPSAHPSLYRRKIAMYRCTYPPPVYVAALTEIRGWVSPAVASRPGCIRDTTNDATTIRCCRPPCILYGVIIIYATLLNWMTLKREEEKALKCQKCHIFLMYIHPMKKISSIWCYNNIILRYLNM